MSQEGIQIITRVILRQIESLGYRVGITYDEKSGRWTCTAEADNTSQCHVARADNEMTAITALAESIGIDLEE